MVPISKQGLSTIRRLAAFGIALVLFWSRGALGANKIYWTDGGGIHRAGLRGEASETLLSVEVSNPEGIAIDAIGGKIYWTDSGTAKIRRANLDGTAPETVAVTENRPRDIAIDPIGRVLFWIEAGRRRKIQRASLDGENIRQVVKTQVTDGIAVNAPQKQVYWIKSLGDGFMRADFNGTNVKQIVWTSPADDTAAIAVSAEHTYWTQWDKNTLDGTNIE